MARLGLMTHRIPNLRRFAFLAREAEQLGFEDMILFTPSSIYNRSRRILAYRFRRGRWCRVLSRYPDIVHDLGYYVRPATISKVRRFKNDLSVECTGYGLGNKWEIHNHLLQSDLAPYLPETELYSTPKKALEWADRYGAIMLKPRNGKGGSGIVKLSRLPSERAEAYVWQHVRRIAVTLPRGAVGRRLRRLYAAGDVLLQRWLDIRDSSGRIFDIRALMQKSPDGTWGMTAMGVRQAAEGRIASNLRAGGGVHEVLAFLSNEFQQEAAEEIASTLTEVACRIPSILEAAYGKPFIELGIDLAVERTGKVSIIEVNVKPGKKIVRALSGEKAYADALLAPIRYAAARAGVSGPRGFLAKGS
jgi:hypothetical protein